MEKTFDVNKKPLKQILYYSLYIPIPSYIYIRELIVRKIKNEDLSYTFKSFFVEGLEILKERNRLNKRDRLFEKRTYMGRKQRPKIETHKTCVTLPIADVDWIKAYILRKKKKYIYFTQPDFLNDLVNELKNKYG